MGVDKSMDPSVTPKTQFLTKMHSTGCTIVQQPAYSHTAFWIILVFGPESLTVLLADTQRLYSRHQTAGKPEAHHIVECATHIPQRINGTT
jgi:hypothetical protein